MNGVFVAVGNVPATDFVRDILDLDESGYFMAGESTKTNVPGVFAAGDCRKKTLRANRDGGCGRRGGGARCGRIFIIRKKRALCPKHKG